MSLDINNTQNNNFKFLKQLEKEIKPLWGVGEEPDFLKPTKVVYGETPFADLKDRGIENRLLNDLVTALPKGTVISGSFMAGVFLEDITFSKDIDVFCLNENAFKETCKLLIENETNKNDDDGNWSICGYSLGTDVSDSHNWKDTRFIKFIHPKRPPIQVLKLYWYKDMRQIIDSFDFTAIQIATDGETIVMNPMGIMDLMRKKLVLHRVQFGASTLRRVIKYTKKGFYACPGFLVQVVEELKNVKATEIDKVVYID